MAACLPIKKLRWRRWHHPKNQRRPNLTLTLQLPAWHPAPGATSCWGACRISPEEASEAFASKGVIGKPAASAEAQLNGRIASDFMSHAAVAIEYHWPDRL